MRRAQPPFLAAWVLQHLPPGKSNEALTGDLFEEFRNGRSTAWYWRQVVTAVATTCLRDIFEHRTVFAFAALWSMLTPAWVLIVANVEKHFNFYARIGQMAWPWGNICDWGVLLLANLFFIWTGIVLYLLLHLWSTRSPKVRPLSRGILASAPVLIAVWAALVVLPKYFLLQHQPSVRPPVMLLRSYAITDRARTGVEVPPRESRPAKYGDKISNLYSPRHAIVDTRPAAIFLRLPFFLCVLCALWEATADLENRPDQFAA